MDSRYVYVDVDGALSKVDRKTGAVQFLTNDTHAVHDLLPIDGALYWLDDEGVHVWELGAVTRRTLASFSKESRGLTHTLVRFRNHVCWGRPVVDAARDATPRAAIECVDLANDRVAPWTTVEGVGVEVAAANDHFYAAISSPSIGSTHTAVRDVTDPSAPRDLADYPTTAIAGFAATAGGPIALNLYDEIRQSPASIWVAQPTPHEVPAPNGAAGIATIAGRTYVIEDATITNIDLTSGKRTAIAATYRGLFCGDGHDIYVRQHDPAKHSSKNDFLLELPNR